MPFGFKKGEKEADLDSKKASLFGSSRSKASKSPAPPSGNPYAAAPPPSNNPYAQQPSSNANPYANQAAANDPYARPSQSSLSHAPTSSFGSLTLNGSERGAPPRYGAATSAPNRGEKAPVPAGGYGDPATPRFQTQGSYGQPSGYGSSDPYGNGQAQRPGGYGGLARSTSQDTMSTDAGRTALFGDAPQRTQLQQQQQSYGQPGSTDPGSAYHDPSSSAPGAYGESRELTAEEQEEEDVTAAKTEIRYLKQQDVASTRNARRVAEEAERTGRETLERLGLQGERIHNTERNLDLASSQNRLAEEKARELKTLNRSMWAVHTTNPFTKKKNEEIRDKLALDKRQHERGVDEATRANAYGTQARKMEAERGLAGEGAGGMGGRNLANRGKYQFEADESDDEKEDEIEDNLYVCDQSSLDQ